VGEINGWMFVDQRIVVACGLKFYVLGKCCAFNKMAVAFTNIKRLTLGKGGEGEIWQRSGRFIRSWYMGRSEKCFVVVEKYLSFR
jgi:hypothetical protein